MSWRGKAGGPRDEEVVVIDSDSGDDGGVRLAKRRLLHAGSAPDTAGARGAAASAARVGRRMNSECLFTSHFYFTKSAMRPVVAGSFEALPLAQFLPAL